MLNFIYSVKSPENTGKGKGKLFILIDFSNGFPLKTGGNAGLILFSS